MKTPPPRYKVILTTEERLRLDAIARNGRTKAVRLRRARALLLSDAGPDGPAWKVDDVAVATGVTSRTIEHLKERFVEEGLDAALASRPRSGPPPRLRFTGDIQARITALACENPPEGFSRWTLQLLAGKLVELRICDSICATTVGVILKKTKSART